MAMGYYAGALSMTFTGAIGAVTMFPLRAIINTCVALGIHPNLLTFVGVLINVYAAVELARGRFIAAGVIMVVANIFDFIDGNVARQSGMISRFGGFWDSVIDRFSDLALFIGLIYLYSSLGRTDYVMLAAVALTFSIMTSYTRARAESIIDKCKVGFMERPERIVLFMIAAFTNRMGAALWVMCVLSILTVADRIYYTWRELKAAGDGAPRKPRPPRRLNPLTIPARMAWNALFWTHERATWQYDVMVVAILMFVWLTPPDWLRDPMASGMGLLGYIW
jgi:CDP-diacylglycerol---glycerol-3-phosphate 3-phosphatidyltransferase